MKNYRPISTIACDILNDWSKVNYAAKPYLIAMTCLNDINDRYGLDPARFIINYFLNNATTWRGPVARKIIAHYNQDGFRAYYRSNDLKEDFLRSYCVKNKERYILDSFFDDPARTIGKVSYQKYYRNKFDIICEVLRKI